MARRRRGELRNGRELSGGRRDGAADLRAGGRLTDLRRLFLRGLVVSLSATALLAIAFLLFAEFDETTVKIIGTTALLSGFSLLGLPGGVLLDEGRAVWLGWLTLGLAGVGLIHALVLLWTEDEAGWKLLVAVVAFAGACAQASGTTARRRDGDSQAVQALYWAGLAGAFLLAAAVSFAAWQEIEDAAYYRFLGALAVGVLLTTLLQPIVRRTGRRDGAASFGIVCTTDDGGEVSKEVEATDFASAVASAIRELERGGRKVVRVERA